MLVDCEPFVEHTEQRFQRLAQYFAESPGILFKTKLYDEDVYPQYKKLSLYKFSHQGFYGDNATPKPQPATYEESVYWDAWNRIKGMSKTDAQRKFLETAVPILDLTDNEELIEHAEREVIEEEYHECVELAVANGADRHELA